MKSNDYQRHNSKHVFLCGRIYLNIYDLTLTTVYRYPIFNSNDDFTGKEHRSQVTSFKSGLDLSSRKTSFPFFRQQCQSRTPTASDAVHTYGDQSLTLQGGLPGHFTNRTTTVPPRSYNRMCRVSKT